MMIQEAWFCLVCGYRTTLVWSLLKPRTQTALPRDIAPLAICVSRQDLKLIDMAFQMHCIRKSLDGDTDETAGESHHCLLCILHLFPRGKLHFLVPSVAVAILLVWRAQKMLAWLSGRGEPSPSPETCLMVQLRPSWLHTLNHAQPRFPSCQMGPVIPDPHASQGCYENQGQWHVRTHFEN